MDHSTNQGSVAITQQSESLPRLIIVSGPPGTGKTTLSSRLGDALRLPVVQRDAIKERLFDTLGSGDRAWSRQLGGASYELLFHLLELLVQTRKSCIVESNFHGEPATTKLRALIAANKYYSIQIQCQTQPDVLLARLRQRSTSGERHAGHADQADLTALAASDLRGYYEPLALDGSVIHLDTTDFNTLDVDLLIAQIAEAT